MRRLIGTAMLVGGLMVVPAEAAKAGKAGAARSAKLRQVEAEAAAAARVATLEQRVADLETAIAQQAAPPPAPVVAPPPPPPPPTYPQVALGGVTRLNTGFFHQDAPTRALVGTADDGITFRTTRLWAKGQLSPDVGFQTELDFAQPGRPNFQNAYLELQNLWGSNVLRLGRWKQPFSLETQTSIRFLNFIERATLFSMVPFRRTGLGLLGKAPDGRSTWGLSAFRAADDNFGNDTGETGGFALAARGTHLFVDSENGAELLHVGGAYHYNDPVGDRVRFSTAPEFVLGSNTRGNTPAFVDTGSLVADHSDLWGAEVAWVHHALSIQGEYARAHVQQLLGLPDVAFPAGYVFVSYFLTGEHRQYSRTLGAFDRQSVHSPFESRRGGGAGAFELTARYSFIDLEDQNVRGRTMNDFTAGVNWHINDHSKIIVNHVRAHLENNDVNAGKTSITGLQAVYDF